MSLAKNTVFNLVGSIVPIAVSLISVPLYLHYIGLERYGVMSICWLLLGYLGLFDFGLGRAVSQRVAAMHDADPIERGAIFWQGLIGSVGLGMIAALAGLVAFSIALSTMKFDNPEIVAEARAVVPLLALILPFTLLNGLVNGTLVGRQRFGAVSVAAIMASLVSTLLPLGSAIVLGPQLSHLVVAILVAQLPTLTFMTIVCARDLPIGRPRRAPAGTMASLLKYGGWVSATNVVAPILSFVDRFMLGAFVGATAVSIYAIPYNLVMRMTIIPEAVSRALFPRFAMATPDDSTRLANEAVKAVSVLVTPLAIVACALITPFLTLWVGQDLANKAAPVAYLLIPGFWMNCAAMIAYNWLQAVGRPDLPAKIHVAQVIPFVALMYVCIRMFGMNGAAILWSFRTAFDAWLMFYVSLGGMRFMRAAIVPMILVVGAVATGCVLPSGGLLSWMIYLVLTILALILSVKTAPAFAIEMVRQKIMRFRQHQPT